MDVIGIMVKQDLIQTIRFPLNVTICIGADVYAGRR